MAITFTNVFKDKILDTIRKFLTTEFAGALSVYTGDFKDMGTQSLRMTPVGKDLSETRSSGEVRDYIVDIGYYFKEKALKRDVWEHILRQVSRIENLFDDNRANTYFNGRLANMRINEKTVEEEAIDGLNVIKWEFRAMYLSNVS